MAERMITVCDVCGEPAAQTITLKVGAKNLLKDLCSRHVAEIVKGTRAPRRGRKPGSKSTGGAAKKTTARRKSTGRRPGRPRKATTEAAGEATA